MLRTAVLIIALLFALLGAWLLAHHTPAPGLQFLGLGLLFAAGVAFERWRYRKSLPTGAHWQATGERFEDPVTGKEVDVLYDPVSGERHYEER
ncbi:MAG TPA: hypothetical protein VMB48_03690 [Steroidobacteraceae bacterium]|nr:hypothetical protein [Steroidobacteraceae bacterium]